MELLTQKFEIIEISTGHKVFCYDKNLCRRLNTYLQEYPDYIFQDGDEAIFHFTNKQLTQVKLALKIKG